MKIYNVEAFVLRMRPLGEADRILTIFSRERGKLNAVAKGARKTQSRFGSRLDFFNRSLLTLHVGRSLDIITNARTVSEVWAQLVDPDNYLLVSYVGELIDALCEPDMEVPELYSMLCELQDAIRAGMKPDVLIAAVDLRLLTTLGFAPELDACARCGAPLGKRPLAGDRGSLSPLAGGLICRRCLDAEFSAQDGSLAATRILVNAKELAALRALRTQSFLELEGNAGVASLNRVTHPFIQHHLGRRSKAMSVLTASTKARHPAASH